MSGRSAHVRKEKTKVKDGATVREEPVKGNSGLMCPNSLIGDFPLPTGSRHDFEHELPYRNNTHQKFSSAKSIASSGSDERHRPIDDMAYARVRKPQVPVLDVSGIEKSSFRSLMDKKSENARNGLAKVFGKKKKTGDAQEVRPATAATVRPASHELDANIYEPSPPLYIKPRLQPQPSFDQMQDFGRPGPPQVALPPVPQPGQLKRWLGSGRSPQPWNKLRKDPELWDPNGDTLVYFGHESQQPRSPPSFRLSSHILEGTESRFLVTLLREGATDEMNAFSMPPSPISSPGMRPVMPISRSQRGMPTPPMSENSLGTFDGQISYEIYFPSPPHLSHPDSLRYQVTTRNVFALLYHASLVGMNLFQALNDLHERLENWMPSDCDNAATIIEYIVSRGIDDVRNDPATAAALLAWSESQGVRWEEGWRESYVHCAGMYNKLEQVSDYRFITPITRALLERASLEVQVRVQSGEERLTDFDFGDMWPLMSSHPPPARTSFERLQKFFCQHYENAFGSWPPANNLPPLGSEDQWLTRGLAQKLQKDFGALYDYLVDREIIWDCSEASSGRKWNITSQKGRAFDADTSDLPFTDILVAFDNRHKYPHIPHPYPLVPESIPVKNMSRENLFKASKKTPPKEDRIAERRAALAYTESTNIYILGSDFVTNDLVDAFVRFEKSDKPAEVDPYAARRGRWVLIYGILQTLATIGVDTPNLRYTNDVSYHLSPKLRGTPPWKGAIQNVDEAGHENSYCWAVPRTWAEGSPPPDNEIPERLPQQKTGGGRSILSNKHSTYMSNRSSAAASDSGFQSDAGSEAGGRRNGSRQGRRPRRNSEKDRDGRESAVSGYSGYSSSGYARGPGFEKVEEWPIREESMRIRQMAKAVQPVEVPQQHGSGNKRGESPLLIKDFDDYNF